MGRAYALVSAVAPEHGPRRVPRGVRHQLGARRDRRAAGRHPAAGRFGPEATWSAWQGRAWRSARRTVAHVDPSAARYVEALTAEVRAVVGDRLVGVYAHGSLLLGGFLPDRSDIDVLVVVEDAAHRRGAGRLASRLQEESLPCPAVGLELSIVTRAVRRRTERPTGVRAARHHRPGGPQGRRRPRPPRRPGPRPPLRSLPAARPGRLRRGPATAGARPGRRRADVGRRAQPDRVRRAQRLPRLALRRRRLAGLQGGRRPVGRSPAGGSRTSRSSAPPSRVSRARPRPTWTPTSSRASPGVEAGRHPNRGVGRARFG